MKFPFKFLSRGSYDDLLRKLDEANAEAEMLRAKAAERNSDENEDAAADRKLIEQLRADNERLSSELKESRVVCEGCKEEDGHPELQRKLAEAKEEVAKREKENEELVNKCTEVSENLQKVKREADQLKEEAEEKVAELEKKVAKLKKDNDELEDEIDEANDSLKKVKDEKREVEQQKEEAEYNLKKAGEENEKLAQAKSIVEEDRNAKSNSLDFVGEILNAAETADDGIKRTQSAADALVDFIRHDLQSAYKEADDEYEVPSDPDDPRSDVALSRWAARAKKTWLEGKKSIAFVGEFSAGKTTIVNTILGQKDLLAVSAEATTAIPTYIMGGESLRFNFVSPDDKMKSLSRSTFRKVSKQVLSNVKGAPCLLKYFVMTSNLPELDSISILDTPGFSSNDAEDAVRTIEVINECDALYWVVDVNAGTVNRSSLKLIKENLHRPLFVVLSHCDVKSPSEIDKVEKLVSRTFEKEGVAVKQIIRFGKGYNPEAILATLESVEKEEDDSAVLGHLRHLCSDIGRREGKSKRSADAEKFGNELVYGRRDAFKSEFDDMAEKCGDIVEFVKGHYEEHFWRSNRYLLSVADGKQLIDDVKSLAEGIEKENDDVNDFKKVVEAAYEASTEFQKSKSELKVLRAAKESFLQKIEAYSPGFKQYMKTDINKWVQDGRKAWDQDMEENNDEQQ